MIIKKADNVYRSIGGRSNPGGVERINRDGKMEILSLGHEEITPKERVNWNAKAKLDPRGRVPEEIYKVEVDEAGNPMAVDDKVRTRLPRKHQFSTEARLSDQRGEKPTFHKSTATSAQAHGVTDGMVADNTFVDPGKFEGDIGMEDRNGKDNRKVDKPEKRKVAKGSPDYKLADAFQKVASSLSVREFLDSKTVASISKATSVSVEDVLLLEKVAHSNDKLAAQYTAVKSPCSKCRRLRMKCPECQAKEVPGSKIAPDGGLAKVSLPGKDDINDAAEECGLLDG